MRTSRVLFSAYIVRVNRVALKYVKLFVTVQYCAQYLVEIVNV